MTIMPMDGANPDIPVTPNNQLSPMPFIWGQGGARLTPEQVLAQRAIANSKMKSDYSPVGSIWEGLGRVTDNITGALEARNLTKQDQANTAESDALLQAVMGGGSDAVTAALTSPYASPQTQQFAKMQWERQNPKPTAPLEFERLLSASGYQPGTPEYTAQANKLLQSRNDPFVTATLPTGDFFAGPQSQFAPYLQGQGAPQPSAAPAAPVGRLTPIQGGQTPPASGGFRPGG